MVVGFWCVIWMGSISQHPANADFSRPPNVKIALLGIDAASWNFLLPWIEQGKLPQFQRLMAEGSWGVLRSRHPTRSPAIWTSIVTGKKRTKHGIYDFIRQENGQQVPSGSHHRRVKALWNILSEQQRSVWVIDWMASYPPETVHGVMVTNLLENQAVSIYNQPDSVYPLELKAELDHLTAPYRMPSFHYPPGRFTDADYARLEQKYLKELEVVEQVALYGCDQTWDLFALYTHAPDAVLHHFWKFMEPQRFRDPIYDLTPENTLRFGDTALRHFQRVDEMLGRLLACFDHNTIVVLVSDHGQWAQTRKPTRNDDRTTGHHHNDGIVIIAGPGIRRGHLFSQNTVDTLFIEFGKMMNDKILPVDIDGSLRSLQLLDYVDITDITPTILYLLGLPVATDMDGRVMARAIDTTHLDQHIIRYIPTYERGHSVDVAPRSAPMSKEMKERLRSLGYIQ
jgi:predicted AlkP superfamily phosphohydrolase/phosphomutase